MKNVAWSLTLNKKCKLKVFENRVLRGMSGAKCEELAGGCIEC